MQEASTVGGAGDAGGAAHAEPPQLCDDAPNLLGLTPAIRAEIRAINASLTGEDVGKLKPIKERCVHGYGLIRLALV